MPDAVSKIRSDLEKRLRELEHSFRNTRMSARRSTRSRAWAPVQSGPPRARRSAFAQRRPRPPRSVQGVLVAPGAAPKRH